MRIIFFAVIAGFCLPAFAAGKLPRVPPGFTIEKVTTSKLVKHPMMAGFDDRGRLFVACSAGKNVKAADLMKDPPNFIKMLEDTDGDGIFDKATVFADKMTLPMGALWYRGALYVASPPHIWKLEDTNNDGIADKRRILVNKFGFSGNAASVHGCFLGPCGRIYWCDGRHGHEFVDKKGKVVSKGKAARIFSCKPDGSDVRVHCGGGMDNPVEIDFTETGEMIGSVNILLSKPRGDCLMHWVEGGVYPRLDQQQCIAEFKSTGDPLPPMKNLGHVAVSGMMRYRSNQFGKKFQNNIFTTLFNTHKVIRSELKRSGATFTTTEHEFLTSNNPDFHPTDVLEDADGSLLVIDTGGWFRIGCPVSKVAKPNIHGAIYRIRRKGAHKIADPRGLKLGFSKMPAKQAVKYLDDPRRAVREKAIDRLFRIGERPSPTQLNPALSALRSVIRSSNSTVAARRNAVWALSQIEMTDEAFIDIQRALLDKNAGVRLAAAHAACMTRYHRSIPKAMLDMVVNDTPGIRRAVARSLGRMCRPLIRQPSTARPEVTAALFNSLRKGDADRVLEHTLIFAPIRMNARYLVVPYLRDSNPRVRRAALIALDQMDGGKLTRELVTPLLDTDDPALQKTTLAIIAKHDGWAKQTLTLLKKWLQTPKLDANRAAIVRGFLIAQSADKSVQKLVGESFLSHGGDTDTAKRLLLLDVMQRSSVTPFPAAWKHALRRALPAKQSAVTLQAVRIVRDRELNFDDLLKPITENARQPVELRAEALAARAPRMKTVDDATVRFLSGELTREHPPLTRLTIAHTLAVSPLNDKQLIELCKTLALAGPLEAPVLLRAFVGSKSEKVGAALVASLNRSKSARGLSPDELNRLLQNYPPSVQRQAQPLLKRLGVNPAKQRRQIAALLKLAAGGSAERGRKIFYGKRAACAGCHTVSGKGGRVGPDLTGIGRIRQPRDLVEAIAFPSASFARGFRSYIIATDRGKIHTGVITRQTTSSITLRTATLAEVRIPRKEIDVIKESTTSIMPKGLDKTLSAAELRDLLAFLRSLRSRETAAR